MNTSKNIFRLTQLVCQTTARNASSKVVPSGRFSGMKTKQEALGVEDGNLVHIKAGFGDRFMFITTSVLISVGTVAGLHAFYTCLVKK